MKRTYLFTNVLQYIPKRYIGLSNKQLQDRKAVYGFKEGNCPASVKEKLADKIKGVIGTSPSSWVVCFIPASTKEKHQRRYGDLANYLSDRVGCNVYVDGIDVAYDRESGHIAGKNANPTENMLFHEEKFRNKKVVLVDDVRTRGVTFEKTADKMISLGAATVFGVFLAQTIHPNLPIDPHPRSFGWEHDAYSEVMDDLMAEQAMKEELAQEFYEEEQARRELEQELAQELYAQEYVDEELAEELGLGGYSEEDFM